MPKPNIILFGASGFLGTKILALKPKTIKLWTIGRSRPAKKGEFKPIELDLLDLKSLEKIFKKIKPNLIIHAARLEPFDDNPTKVKSYTKNLAEIIKRNKIKLIYISSDAVFDGRKGNYQENDKPHPLTNYGRAKLAAELAIRKNLKNYIIVRTSYIYGQSNGRWDKRTEKLIEEIKKNRVAYRFKDMYRSPILVDDLAKAVWRLAKTDFCGTIHIAGKKKSIYRFSREIIKKIGLDPKTIKPDFLKIRRPKITADTSLNISLAKKIGIR